MTAASIIGLGYLLPEKAQVQPSFTSGTSSNFISKLMESSSIQFSSTQRYALQGRLFFDYNGDGKQEEDEPPVQNAKVQIADAVDNSKIIAEVLTDSSGDYKANVPAGSYQLFIRPDTSNPENPNFRYMCRSNAEFRNIWQGYPLTVAGDGRFDVGLMEGFLTLPMLSDTEIDVKYYVDLDPRTDPEDIRDWMGGRKTYKGHPGTDLLMDHKTIVASAPGYLIAAVSGWPNYSYNVPSNWATAGNFIGIYHNNGYSSWYEHLDSIEVEEVWPVLPPLGYGLRLAPVNRGDVIAVSDWTGTERGTQPHVHFQTNVVEGTDVTSNPIDPFRDLLYNKFLGTPLFSPKSDKISLWTKDNDPKYYE